MPPNAYAGFFFAILLGCIFSLFRTLWLHRETIAVALRAELPPHLQRPSRWGLINIRTGLRFAFAPIVFKISRI